MLHPVIKESNACCSSRRWSFLPSLDSVLTGVLVFFGSLGLTLLPISFGVLGGAFGVLLKFSDLILDLNFSFKLWINFSWSWILSLCLFWIFLPSLDSVLTGVLVSFGSLDLTLSILFGVLGGAFGVLRRSSDLIPWSWILSLCLCLSNHSLMDRSESPDNFEILFLSSRVLYLLKKIKKNSWNHFFYIKTREINILYLPRYDDFKCFICSGVNNLPPRMISPPPGFSLLFFWAFLDFFPREIETSLLGFFDVSLDVSILFSTTSLLSLILLVLVLSGSELPPITILALTSFFLEDKLQLLFFSSCGLCFFDIWALRWSDLLNSLWHSSHFFNISVWFLFMCAESLNLSMKCFPHSSQEKSLVFSTGILVFQNQKIK